MISYTTPTITLNIRNFTFPDECDIYVTLRQGSIKITKRDPEVTATETGTRLRISLTQAESGQFNIACSVSVQVNYITSSGYRNATKIKSVVTFQNLLDEVIQYGA